MRAQLPSPLFPPASQPQVAVRIIILIVVVTVVITLTLLGYSIDAAVAAVVLCGGATAELAVRLGLPAPDQNR